MQMLDAVVTNLAAVRYVMKRQTVLPLIHGIAE